MNSAPPLRLRRPLRALAVGWGLTGGCAEPTPSASGPTVAGETTAACDALDDGPGGEVVGAEDCDGGICEVAAGLFWMGIDEPDACPIREVELAAFAIDRSEVTLDEYQSCVDDGGCASIPDHCLETLGGWHQDLGALPATCVSWEDAAGWCDWAGGRLPTEAEWEKAARGDDGAIWPWGDVPPDCEDANFRFSSWYCSEGVEPVGSYDRESAYGLVDTAGNAWEWVDDWYDAGWYRDAPDLDPEGPGSDCRSEPDAELGACVDRVLRGGAYNTTAATTRGGARSHAAPDVRDLNIGFRCAWDVEGR